MTAASPDVPRLLPFYLAQGIALASLASVITLLGDIRDTYGLSETRLGLIVGSGFIAAFVTQLTLGRFADRGYAPQMVRFGLLAMSISMIGFAFGSTFWEFVLWRSLLGVAVGLAQPAIRRTVILTESDQAGRNIGRLGLAEVIGFALGPAVAGILVELRSFELPFYVMAVLGLVTLLSIRGIRADEGARAETDEGPLSLLRNRRFVGTLLVVASEFLLIGSYEAVWAVMATDLGASTLQIGLTLTAFAVPLGALAPLGGAWAQKTENFLIAVVGLAAAATLAMPIAFIETIWGIAVMAVIAAIGAGIGFPAGLYFFSRTVSDERQAAAQGLLGATEVLFGGLAAVTAAWLYDLEGQIAVWLVLPTITLIVLLSGLLLRDAPRRAPANTNAA